jgi:hypothetical protein
MEKPDSKRKRRVILKASICGAVLFDAIILVGQLIYVLRRHGYVSDFWYDNFSGIGFVSIYPSMLIQIITGYKGVFLNEYLVNGLLGAISFALIAILRYKEKGDHENKE